MRPEKVIAGHLIARAGEKLKLKTKHLGSHVHLRSGFPAKYPVIWAE